VYIARLPNCGLELGGVAIIFLAGSICFGVASFRTKKKMFSVRVPLSFRNSLRLFPVGVSA